MLGVVSDATDVLSCVRCVRCVECKQSRYIQSNERGELSKWLCYDDSTINIGIGIIMIIITIIIFFI